MAIIAFASFTAPAGTNIILDGYSPDVGDGAFVAHKIDASGSVVVSNQGRARHNGVGTFTVIYDGAMPGPDYDVFATLRVFSLTGAASILARLDPYSTTGIWFGFDAKISSWVLAEVVDGVVYQEELVPATVQPGQDYLLRLRVQGNTATAYVNGQQVASIPVTITDLHYAGFSFDGDATDSTGLHLDDWGIEVSLVEVGRDAPAAWNIRTLVGRDAPLTWNIAEADTVTVGRDAGLGWNIQGLAGRDAPAAWNIRTTAGRDAPLAWNVAEVDVVTVGRDAPTAWNVRTLVGRDAPAAWNVRTNAGRDADLAWSIRNRVGRDASMAWNVRGDVVAGDHYSVHLRVLVRDAAGVWQDLSQLDGEDWILSARIDDDIDFPVAQAEVELAREGPAGSIAPFMASPLNIPGPLIDVGRELKIDTQITAVNVTPQPANWRTVFHGHIDHVSWPRRESRVTVRARDLGGVLLDTWIEEEKIYGSEKGTPIEEVMQQLLDDTLGAGVVQLVVPWSPGFLITPYTQEPMSLLEALQRLADLIGWTVRYRWHGPSGAFRLTFYEPPRHTTTPVAVIGPDQYIDVEDLAIDRAGIRNVISVSYRDAATGQRAEVEVINTTSVARFGRRWMQIQEADTSPIDTAEEALTLANAALSDLALPHAEQEIEMHYWGPVEIGDLLRFEPNGVHYSDPQDLAVVSWRHEFAVGRARTWIRTRGRPAGAYRRWFFATRDRIGAPAISPVLDEDQGRLYLHPYKNEFCGSVRYVVSPHGIPTLEQVRAGTVSAAERILVHTFVDDGNVQGLADSDAPMALNVGTAVGRDVPLAWNVGEVHTVQEQRVYVAVLPYRRANGTGAEGSMVVLAYTYRPGNDVPVITWFPITPSAPDKEAVRLVVNDDGDQVALYYRTYAKGSSPPAFTRIPAYGFAPDPLVHDVEVTTPAEGEPNIVLEAYGVDDGGRRTARNVVIEFDHGEVPSGTFELEVDEGGRVWCQINTLDPDTGSARVRVVKGSADTPAFESPTFVDDANPSDGKVELARTVSAFADRIDTGLTLAQGEAAYLVGQFFRTLSPSPAAQQASRASDELRVWRSRGGGGGGGTTEDNYVRLIGSQWIAGKGNAVLFQLHLETGPHTRSLLVGWSKTTAGGVAEPHPFRTFAYDLSAAEEGRRSTAVILQNSSTLGDWHSFALSDEAVEVSLTPYTGDVVGGVPQGVAGQTVSYRFPVGKVQQVAPAMRALASTTSQLIASDQLVAPEIGGLRIVSAANDVGIELDDKIHSLGAVSGTVTPNFTNGRVQEMTLAGNVTINNPTNVRPGATYILIIVQDAVGGRSISWGSAYKWPNGTPPNLATAPSTVHVVSMIARAANFLAAVAQRSFS